MAGLKFAYLNKNEIKCGLLVSLIALPLSIGIAIASGAPPTAGLIAAVSGGIIAGLFSRGGPVINGPAAGLIVIVLGAIQELGGGDALAGFKAVLACTVIAGAIQMVMGKFKLATLGLVFPSGVVHGMLSAIGLIIISKQLYPLLGLATTASSPVELYLGLPHALLQLNPGIALIGASVLCLLLAWPRLPKSSSQKIPGPLAGVLLGVGLGLALDLHHDHLVQGVITKFNLGPRFLLTIPENLATFFFLPDFRAAASLAFWKHTLLIAMVGGVESTLSVCAVDKLDPAKKKSDLNRSLLANGLANVVSGMVGGLPIIAEIVRSSANISNGSKTQCANFFHAVAILFFLVFLPSLLHEIPLAALAALLIMVGYRLASPKTLMHAIKQKEGVVFASTVLVILATDLLTGILVGTLLEIGKLAFQSKSLNFFQLDSKKHDEDQEKYIAVEGPLAFTNYLKLREQLALPGDSSRLTLDLRKTSFLDSTVREHLHSHERDYQAAGKVLIIHRPQNSQVEN